MERNRSWRRHQSSRVQKKRYKKWASWGSTEWLDSPKQFGKLKKGHFGCGCSICKPQKIKPEDKYKFSEKKKLMKE